MSASEPTTLRLRVAEAAGKDVGRAFARLDPADLARLGAASGDLLLVRGRRAAVCRAMPAHAEARGQSRVQLDGIARENAGAALDESVSVGRVDCPAAQRVVLSALSAAPGPKDLDYLAELLDGIPVTPGDRVRATLFGSRAADFEVSAVEPDGAAVIQGATRLALREPEGARADARLSYEDVGGLRPQLQRVREMIELPLRHPEIFDRLGIEPPKGVLLYGPPGTGKTLIARAIAQETAARFFAVSGPEIIHKFYGESEAHLRSLFEQAAKEAPSVVFLDEIDAIAPRRERVVGEVEKRVVAQLLALLDGLSRRQNVVVIAATNLPDALDPALRRPGRLDREIEIPIPDRPGRLEILEVHSRGMPLASDVDLRRLAEVTHGFVGADLEALCREAAMACLRRSQIDWSAPYLTRQELARLRLTMEDFGAALTEVEPSAIREVFVEVPAVAWSDVGGLSSAKEKLVRAVEWPLVYADLYAAAGVNPPRGVLLAGPPGTGKTLLARAVAHETGANFISVKGPALLSMYVGESERAVREIFRKARQAAPCVVFFDEVDAFLGRRQAGSLDSRVDERVLGQFLSEFDGIEESRGVLVLAATNRSDLLDPALLRPGRFDERVELGLPDESDRREIFEVHLRGKPLGPGVDAAELAASAEGLSGAELARVVARAAEAAVGRAISARGRGIAEAPRLEAQDLRAEVAAARSAVKG